MAPVQNITAAIKTYTGHTYIFHTEKYIVKCDDCIEAVINYMNYQKYFPGLLYVIQGAFRYTNGHFYFFKDK